MVERKMSFNQGFGSNQAFGSGQWPLQQNQQPQQQLHIQGQPQQFIQAWQNPGQNQQAFPPSNFGWQAPSQHMAFQSTQGMHHQAQSNIGNTGNNAAQNQELLKRQKFEEQKRKLKEMSSKGAKSKQEAGKSMLDDLISKADLGLSSSSSSGSVKKSTNPRPTNVFTGHPRPENGSQHANQEGASQPQVFPQASNQIVSSFPLQTDITMSHQSTQQQQLQQQQQQQWNQLPQLQSQHQFGDFGSNPAMNWHGNPQTDDDFGDFQGGNAENVHEPAPGSLNSSTSSLSSLKSSFNSGAQQMIMPNPEKVSPGAAVPGMYSNQPHQHVPSSEASSLPSAIFPYQAAIASQNAEHQYGMSQNMIEGFSSSSKAQPLPFSSAPGFQSTVAYPGTSITVSTGPTAPISAFPASSNPELVGQSVGAHYAESVPIEQRPVQLQANLIENPLLGDDDPSIAAHLYGCQLPAWLHDAAVLPSVYKKVLDKSLSLDGSIDTAKVTDILRSSNVPKDRLRDIWGMANKKNPGILVEDELYLILGLLALSQAGWTKLSISKLSSCKTAPIPEFPEHILMEVPAGSVFGGDVLTINSNSRSSSPVDPDDKYSFIRSHSKHSDPVLIPSGIAVSSNTTNSLGWSASLTSGQSEESGTDSQYSDFQRADNVEGWADFQSSANPIGFTATVIENTGKIDSKQGVFGKELAASEFSITKMSGVIKEVSTDNPAVLTSGSNVVPMVERSQQNPGLFEGGAAGAGPGERIEFQSGNSASTGTDNPMTSGDLDWSAFSAMKKADFNSIAPSIVKAQPVTTQSVGAIDFNAFSMSSARFHEAETMDRKVSLTEQRQINDSSRDDEFGDFSSININAISSDLISSNHGNKMQTGSAQILTTPSTFQADFTTADQENNGDVGDDSWNEFTSFPSITENFDNNKGASYEPTDKQQHILGVYSIPFENTTTIAKEDSSLALTDLSLKDVETLPSDKSLQLSEDSYSVFTKSEESVQLTDKQSSASRGIDGDFSGFLFKTPPSENKAPNAGTTFASNEDGISGTVSFGVPTQSEFASFASFDSSKAQEISIFESIDNQNAPPLEESLLPTTTMIGAFVNKEGSTPQDLPFSSVSGDFRHEDRALSELDDGEFGKGNIITEAEKSTKSQFVLSQRVLDVSEELSTFTATAKRDSAPSVASSFQKPIGSVTKNMPQQSSQDSDFIESALDAKDRYKALTGVLEDSELHVHEWKRCLDGVKRVFESATSMMKKHNLSLNSKREIFESEKGKQYFNGLKEIFAVACRIGISVENSAIARSNDDLKRLTKDIERCWREISSFSSGLPEYSFPDASKFPTAATEGVSPSCGICLLELNDQPLECNNWKMSIANLAYGSRIYHSTCANFWCNKVSPVLPALTPLASGLL